MDTISKYLEEGTIFVIIGSQSAMKSDLHFAFVFVLFSKVSIIKLKNES